VIPVVEARFAKGATLIVGCVFNVAPGRSFGKGRRCDFPGAFMLRIERVPLALGVLAAARSFDGAPFRRLLKAEELMLGKGSRTYLEIERE
jgi:hypothetical protein